MEKGRFVFLSPL